MEEQRAPQYYCAFMDEKITAQEARNCSSRLAEFCCADAKNPSFSACSVLTQANKDYRDPMEEQRPEWFVSGIKNRPLNIYAGK